MIYLLTFLVVAVVFVLGVLVVDQLVVPGVERWREAVQARKGKVS